jgi:hypothetical protein
MADPVKHHISMHLSSVQSENKTYFLLLLLEAQTQEVAGLDDSHRLVLWQ